MSHRVVLYTKESCSLCDEAQRLLDEIGHPYETAEDPRFALRVPVIEVDGEIVAEAPVEPESVRRALGHGR